MPPDHDTCRDLEAPSLLFFYFFSICWLTRADDVDVTVIFDIKEEGERATWRSLIRRRQPFSFCRLLPILSFSFTVNIISSFVVLF